MKQQKLRRLTSIVPAMALIVFISACATQIGNVASSDVQTVFVQSGFKVRTATTPLQRLRLQRLPEHQFTVVKQNEENFYVWADKPNNRLYCGNEQVYRRVQGTSQGTTGARGRRNHLDRGTTRDTGDSLSWMGAVSRVVIAVPNDISPNHRESRAPRRA
jgi:hypothetical protein